MNAKDIKPGMLFDGWCGCGECHHYRVLEVNNVSGAVQAEVIGGKEDGRKVDLSASQIIKVEL